MNLASLGAEIIIIATGVFLLVADIIIPDKYRDCIGYISLTSLIIALIYAISTWANKADFVVNTVSVDELSMLIRLAIIVLGILVNLAAIKNTYTIQHNQGEFFSLLMFSLSGSMILAGARELVTIYVGLELNTIPAFILVAFRKARPKTGEAVIKFFILGLLSSAFLLYGLSLVYGLSGEIDLGKIATSLGGNLSPALVLAGLFVIAGFGFKITAVPFHFWAPDTYEGAPVVVVSYLATVSKLGAFAVITRFFVTALIITKVNWPLWFGALAIITMTLGNMMALPQKNIKRMMAYSGIGSAGYLLTGFAIGTNYAITAMFFYLIAYAFSVIGIFFVISVYSSRGEADAISGYAGMAQTNPALAAVMLVSFLSLTGIPPLAGFIGKFHLIMAAIQNSQSYLAVILTVNTVISLAYYGRIMAVMYIKDPDADRKRVHSPLTTSIALGISIFTIVYLGIMQSPLLNVAKQIFVNIKL